MQLSSAKEHIVAFTWQQCLRERATIWHRTYCYILPVLLNFTISCDFLQAFNFFISQCFYTSVADRPVHHLSPRPIHQLYLSSPLPYRNPSRLLDPWYRRRISQDNKESHSNAVLWAFSICDKSNLWGITMEDFKTLTANSLTASIGLKLWFFYLNRNNVRREPRYLSRYSDLATGSTTEEQELHLWVVQEISRVSTQPPTQSVPDDTYVVVKWPGRDGDRSPLPNAESNNRQVSVCPPPYVAWLFA